MTQNSFTFLFPPIFFDFDFEAVHRLWGPVQELKAIPSCLPWLRFTLCHGLGSSCRTDALQFCLLDFLHKGLCSALTGSRWLIERKKRNPHHVFVIFLTVYGFLWHTDCSWMCKKAGLEVSMRLPSHSSHKNSDALGLVVFSRARCCSCHGPWATLASSFPFPFSPKFLFLGKAGSCVGDSGSLACEIPKIAGEPPKGDQSCAYCLCLAL